MGRLVDKFFYLNAWSVGWRHINDTSHVPIKEITKYHTISVNDYMYYADPFIIENSDGVYLFVESMNRYRGKGTISVAKLEDDKFSNFEEVLLEPFHLSYPNVFQYDGCFFMIPETSEIGQIRLYKAIQFPQKWELDCILLNDGNRWVDSSLQNTQRGLLLCSFYEKDGNKTINRFELDMGKRKLLETDIEGLYVGRPAGNSFISNGIEYRPIQNDRDYYGKSTLLFYLNNQGKEIFAGEISPQNFLLSPRISNLTGTHTINRSEHFEVVDFKYNRFCKTKLWIRLISFFDRW